VRHEEAEAIYDAGREVVVETLLALSARVEELSRTVAEQAARIEGLERRLYRDSQNSSLAPSSDSPMSRQQRPAPGAGAGQGLAAKAGWSARPRGQGSRAGRSGSDRGACEHLPRECSGCGHHFDGAEERLGEPLIHQKWDLSLSYPRFHGHGLVGGMERLRGCSDVAGAEANP